MGFAAVTFIPLISPGYKMKRTRYYIQETMPTAACIFALLLSIAGPVFGAGFQDDPFGDYFTHTATTDNISGNWTAIDHSALNSNPEAIVLVTQNWNPGGGTSGTYNDHAIGVWYNGANWAVFNQNEVAMTENASFNIVVPGSGAITFVHKATTDNISLNWTVIDHPLLNGNPDANLMITQNWNPGAEGGTYNDHNVGAWYDGSNWAIFNQDEEPMPENAAFNVLINGGAATTTVHTATIDNISLNYTLIDHPLTNDNPNAFVTITQNWNPGDIEGTYNDHEVGVWYNGSKWGIFNQDEEAMPENAAFNVSVLNTKSTSFDHVATTNNISLNWSVIDHPSTNDNPNAIIIATQNWNPGGLGGVYNDHNVGVWYDGSKWAVFNQDTENMPENAAFNVLIPGSAAGTFVHTADETNISLNYTLLDHPSLNGNPDAIVKVTQNWNPGDVEGVYNDHAVGVWYTGSQWSIFNQDEEAMPQGASFNVLVLDAASEVFVHTATTDNISSNWTVIDNPLTNDNPTALLTVTQNWNPGGSGDVYNNHEVGVWYDGSKWAIFNQDEEAMPEGASFNVLVYGACECPGGIVSNENGEATPDKFQLSQNYPNPFNPSTTISYEVAAFSEVKLTVFNMIGQEVRTLVDGRQAAGLYEVTFDASGLPSGTYVYRLSAGDHTESKVMALMK